VPNVYRNAYRCHVERNSNQRYEVRLEAHYGRADWTLRVFFLAHTPERALARMQAVLRFLQREEGKLCLWGADPADRELLFEELLANALPDGAGLRLDRRRDFPRTAPSIVVPVGEPLTLLLLAELKRKVAARLELKAAPRLPRKAAVLSRSA